MWLIKINRSYCSEEGAWYLVLEWLLKEVEFGERRLKATTLDVYLWLNSNILRLNICVCLLSEADKRRTGLMSLAWEAVVKETYRPGK